MASGPNAGFAEIVIPAVHPGSSIMPGKVNPSLAECLDMICFNIVGNDVLVAMAAQAGQFELNVMLPGMTKNAAESPYWVLESSRDLQGINGNWNQYSATCFESRLNVKR